MGCKKISKILNLGAKFTILYKQAKTCLNKNIHLHSVSKLKNCLGKDDIYCALTFRKVLGNVHVVKKTVFQSTSLNELL